MRISPLVALALLVPALAGCVAPARPLEPSLAEPVREQRLIEAAPANATTVKLPLVEEVPVPPPPPALPLLRLGAQEARGTGAMLVQPGAALAAVPDGFNAACVATNCATWPIALEFEPGFWDHRDGGVEATVAWGGHESVDFVLEVLDAKGERVGASDGGEYAQVVLLDEPASGTYVAVVKAARMGGDYALLVQLEAREPEREPREILPNLVALRPKDISLFADSYFMRGVLPAPLGISPKQVARDALGLQGCGLDEGLEAQARRCLRFASAVGNVGEGPLEVRLRSADEALSLAGQGQFVQRIFRTDGSFREEPTGPAFYHPTHQHLHFAGLATFQLHPFDPATSERGDPIGQGRKAGFCMVDEGLVSLAMVGNHAWTYTGEGCDFLLMYHTLDDPTGAPARGAPDAFMGISPGWFDMYEVDRPDQYVEITGLKDGTYELVATADGDHTLVESNEDDNESSVVFELKGNEVRVLGGKGPTGPFDASYFR